MKIITIEDVFTEENMCEQYQIALHGKRDHTRIIKYEEHWLSNLNRLRNTILTGNYIPKPDHKFTIHEPKMRAIIANDFEDKIIQGLLVRKVLMPLIEPKLIYDNYASRPNMGTDMAYRRLKEFLRSYYINNSNSNEGYILKCDIKKYFYTISVPLVLEMIDRLDMDDKLKDLFHIEIRPSDGIDTGICIGHEISQWLAIFYLNSVDHLIKEKLKIKYYGRYMDDFYLIHHDKNHLNYCLLEISNELRNLRLSLNNKTQIMPLSEGLKFLGFHTYLTDTGKVRSILLKSSVKRVRKRMRSLYQYVKESPELIYSAIESFSSWKSHAVKGSNRKIIYLLDIEFYNLYYDILSMIGIKYAYYCYLPGMYEKDSRGNKKMIKLKDKL